MSLREHVVEQAREDPGAGSFRFGAVFLLTLTLCVFLIVAPDADWARAVALALQSAALIVVVATSRASAAVRRKRTVAAGAAAVVVFLAVATGAVASVGGVRARRGHEPRDPDRDRRRAGAADAPAAASRSRPSPARSPSTCCSGIVFAWLYALFGQLADGPFFTGADAETQGSRVYFSFTALTTTGFGDLAAATDAGRALVVLEMLVGQLYLVTVIGVLVGNFGRR